MKINKLSLGLVTAFTLVLAGCNLLPGKNENQTTGDYDQSGAMMEEPLSENTDFDTVETELNDTKLQEFDSELNELDQEINNL